jgi:hypothetical protein
MPHETVTIDELMTERMDMGSPSVGDLDAAGWGGSWLPSSQVTLIWADPEHQDGPAERSTSSSDVWDLWPIFERFGQSRRMLIGP